VVSIQDLPGTTADRLFAVARGLARTLRQTDAVRADGVNLFVADGEAAGQDVFHAHLHVIPRFAGDGFVVDAAAWRDPQPTRQQLDAVADAIQRDLHGTDELGGGRIRTIVIGVAMKDERIFAIGGTDSVTSEFSYRPPGGGVEFGETSEAALRREFREELDVELTGIEYVGALENLFGFEGRTGHEVVFVYRVELPPDDRLHTDRVAGRESDGTPFEARWLSLDDVRNGSAILYPTGLLRLLDTGLTLGA
jgi:8-oxo-dGTP pyrophosphatase MutT (NUDIX family)